MQELQESDALIAIVDDDPSHRGIRSTGRFGNSPRLSFHNPGLNSVDFMIGKKLFVREGMNAVFRAEFFNVFNHTNFSDVDNSLT